MGDIQRVGHPAIPVVLFIIMMSKLTAVPRLTGAEYVVMRLHSISHEAHLVHPSPIMRCKCQMENSTCRMVQKICQIERIGQIKLLFSPTESS